MAQRSRARREEREKQKRRNQQMTILAVVGGVAILIFILFVVSNQPAEAPIPENLGAAYSEIEQSFNEKGYPVLGNPDADVKVVEYSSFGCPGCAQFHEQVLPQVLERVRQGNVSFTYVPIITTGSGNVDGAARTALCAGEQGKFWEMHDILFSWHLQFANAAFSQNRILAGVEALGLDRDAFNACFNSQRILAVIEAAADEGIASTPTIQVNGSTVAATAAEVLAAIDNALLAVGSAPSRPTVELTPEATEAPQVEATEPPAEATEAVEATESADD